MYEFTRQHTRTSSTLSQWRVLTCLEQFSLEFPFLSDFLNSTGAEMKGHFRPSERKLHFLVVAKWSIFSRAFIIRLFFLL